MFSSSVVGCANALVGGWGNMGGGVTYILMPLIFDAITRSGINDHAAWRIAMVVPAGLCFIVGLTCLLFSDDCPQGDWSRRKQQINEIHIANDDEKKIEIHYANKDIKSDADSITNSEKDVKTTSSSRPTIGMFFVALKNPNVIILMLMYACSFGIELSVDNVIGLFFHDHFSLSQTKAGMIGALFGLMNLFSRATGGFLSDFAYKKRGIRGRIFVHFIIIFLNGVFLIAFRFSLNNLRDSIIILVIFSFFTQACCGSVFGIVPFVDPTIVGAVSGLVGAGGNIGGLIFTGVFNVYANNTPFAFMVLGLVVMGVSFTTFLIRIKN
ncbi:nitrate transporter [Glomus cerebriforme]|uniref:Nitrate transporter n=1 Tax=Glomus cerebriforme TaxID=658196 RepID=A0A397T1J2_9GLOM|nr:nitrate transporter [Glomus cerebriforme]